MCHMYLCLTFIHWFVCSPTQQSFCRPWGLTSPAMRSGGRQIAWWEVVWASYRCFEHLEHEVFESTKLSTTKAPNVVTFLQKSTEWCSELYPIYMLLCNKRIIPVELEFHIADTIGLVDKVGILSPRKLEFKFIACMLRDFVWKRISNGELFKRYTEYIPSGCWRKHCYSVFLEFKLAKIIWGTQNAPTTALGAAKYIVVTTSGH